MAEARVPLLHVYGDADEVVPWDENTGVLAVRYRKLGGSITLMRPRSSTVAPDGPVDVLRSSSIRVVLQVVKIAINFDHLSRGAVEKTM